MKILLLTMVLMVVASSASAQDLDKILKDHEARIERIQRLARIGVEQAHKYGWEHRLEGIAEKLREDVAKEKADFTERLIATGASSDRILKIDPEYQKHPHYLTQLAEEQERVRREEEDRLDRIAAEQLKQAQSDAQERRAKEKADRQAKLASHPKWSQAKVVDAFGDDTGEGAYSLKVTGTMVNTATDGSRMVARVFYKPDNHRKLIWKLYDYGTSPVHNIEDKMKISFKLEADGSVQSGWRLNTETDQFYLDQGSIDQKLVDLLRDGHIIKVLVEDGTSRWLFTISGNGFPQE